MNPDFWERPFYRSGLMLSPLLVSSVMLRHRLMLVTEQLLRLLKVAGVSGRLRANISEMETDA